MMWFKIVIWALFPLFVLVATMGFTLGMAFNYKGEFQWLSLFPAGLWGCGFLGALYFSVEQICEIFKAGRKKPEEKHLHVTIETLAKKRVHEELDALRKGTYPLDVTPRQKSLLDSPNQIGP